MKKSILKPFIIFCLFFLGLAAKSNAQYFLNVTNSLTPACIWSIQVTDNMGNVQTITNTGISSCFLNTPVSISLFMAGCNALTWTPGGTWTGPFLPPACIPSSFCAAGSGNFTINTGVSCGGSSSNEYVFTF